MHQKWRSIVVEDTRQRHRCESTYYNRIYDVTGVDFVLLVSRQARLGRAFFSSTEQMMSRHWEESEEDDYQVLKAMLGNSRKPERVVL